MTFGVSIGDGIALAGLIERIATEIKDYRQAPEHFQQLAIELYFLREVILRLKQIDPTSSRQDEVAHFDRIKTITTYCSGPLTAFLDKMKTFEPFLGQHKVTGGFKGVGKRLHWSMSISKKEVGELRAVVVSQILAINTLLNAQQWECLQAVETRQGASARALEDLISTTTAFAQRMELCFKDRDDFQNKIQQVLDLVTGDRQSSGQERSLLSSKITASSSMIRNLSRSCKSSFATVNKIQKNTSKGFKHISAFAAKLEQGLKMISSFTSEILAAIKSNKQLLLEMFAVLKWLQSQLPKHIDLPIIRFDDALGNTLALPFQMCREWKKFRKLLKNMYEMEDARFRIERGLFVITNAKGERDNRA